MVLFRLIKKRSVSPFMCFWSFFFFRTPDSQLCFRLFWSHTHTIKCLCANTYPILILPLLPPAHPPPLPTEYCKGPSPLSDSVRRSDQLLRVTKGADQWNQRIRDFSGPLHWFPVATDRIVGPRRKVHRGLKRSACQFHDKVLNHLTWLTFHQNDEDVSHNGDGGDENEYREQESADGVRHFPLRLQPKERFCTFTQWNLAQS